MRFKTARFVGLIGVCRASGLKEIFIDFTKCKNKIILMIGENGSGKSTIQNALNPFPDSPSDYLSHEDGLKELVYIMNDGIEYTVRIEYPVNKLGERIQTKAYLFKNVNGNISELNPNGNIGSYKDAIYNEFSLDTNFIALSQLSVENRGLVEKTPAERKKFVGSGALINSIEVYNNIYKTLNKRSSVFRSMINSIVAKIDSIGNEENINSTLISLNNRIDRLENQKDKLNKDLSDAESIIRLTDPDGILQNRYTLLQVQIDSIQDKLNTINLFLKQIKGKSDKRYYDQISSYENCVKFEKEIEVKIISLQSDIDKAKSDIQNLLISREEESSSINLKINRLNSLKSEYNYNDLVNEIKRTKNNISEYLKMFNDMGVSPETTMTKDEFIIGINTLKQLKEQVDIIRSYSFETEIEKAIYYTLNNISIVELINECENKISSYNSEKSKLEQDLKYYQGLYDKLDILNNRPENCKINTCSFIKDALSAKQKDPEGNINTISEKLYTVNLELKDLNNELELLNKISQIMHSVKMIIRYINNNRVILDKLPNGNVFSDEKIFLNHLLNGSTFNEIYDLYKYVDQANVFELYKRDTISLKNLESEYKIYESKSSMIDEIQADIDSITNKINGITENITNMNSAILEKQKAIENAKSLLEIVRNSKDKYETKAKLEAELHEKMDSIRDISNKMRDIESAIQAVNSINQSLLNINNELNPIKKDRDSIKFSIDKLSEYKAELKIYQDKYEKVELIKKYSSPTKAGIQNLFIEVYMGQTLSLANQLLSKLFGGTLELGKYVINDKEFRIPCKSIDSPIVNDDISSCSTGQKCMISMILSFALLKQGSTKYNIIRLDEIDGGLDQNNRAMFIEVLDEIMGILEVEHCIMVSHSSEAVLEDTDIILLNPVGSDIPKGNIIFTYNDNM